MKRELLVLFVVFLFLAGCPQPPPEPPVDMNVIDDNVLDLNVLNGDVNHEAEAMQTERNLAAYYSDKLAFYSDYFDESFGTIYSETVPLIGRKDKCTDFSSMVQNYEAQYSFYETFYTTSKYVRYEMDKLNKIDNRLTLNYCNALLSDEQVPDGPIDLNADWSCVFVVDEEDEETFVTSNLEYRFEAACEKAIFIQDTLQLPLRPYYKISFGISALLNAWYLGDGKILITKRGLINSDLQFDFIHELTHSALEDIALPVWFEEGVSARMSDLVFERNTAIKREGREGIELLDPFILPDSRENDSNLRYANYVVKEFIEEYGMDSLRATLSIMKEKQIYGSIVERNTALIDAMREATGDESITLNKIVYFEAAAGDEE